ncbi:MAG: type I polyketide synthase, partial [Cyanobacteria bacterium J06642_3]
MSSDINQRVLAALKEAKEKLTAIEQQKEEAIAIVGMAGRFPGAKNIDEYWQNLQQGVNSIQFLSDRELAEAGVSQDLIKNPNYVRAYSSFADIDSFAADFFGYSPLEAEVIDPQQRIFLESAYEALENAGYDSDRYEGKIGVFAGSALNSYLINLHSSPEITDKLNQVQIVISNVMGLMPTRVSYKLNLKGASCGVQTGCSTSLVAVHLACQSLLNNESDLALAGGVTINAEGKQGYLYQEGSIASPDGYCRAFDAEGKGTVFGNGVGIVVLKKLSAAIKDHDHIWAVIKGSAINNDGSDKVGLTAPSVSGQAEAIAQAWQQGKIEPETISYIEAHGTGTSLGDPIELAALNKVFRQQNSKSQDSNSGKLKHHKCAIGSVKTNIGHLDAAAGISGLIKTVLALHHQQIPPSLNFEAPNPDFDFANSPFYVNTELTPWQTNGTPRRAGVSSFGMGGTNSHVVLEEAPRLGVGEIKEKDSSPSLLVISAKTATELDAATLNLASHLEKNPDLDLKNVAYTLQAGRRAYNYRRLVVCQNSQEAVTQLRDSLSNNFASNQQQALDNPAITFMFSGQGSQYSGMATDLYEHEPVFKEVCDRCFQILQPYLDNDLKEIIFPPAPQLPSSSAQINQTQYAQPAIFVIEYALAQLWISWGVQPENLIGHSIGEYVAATIAGVFSLEDALKIVAKRGALMQHCPSGAMLSVAMAVDKAREIIADLPQLSIAVINAPELCVISGTEEAIAKLESTLPERGIACRRLHTSHAFHSEMMAGVLAEFTAELSGVTLNPPQLPFISNVSGTWITLEEATSLEYWSKHLRQTVRFSEGIQTILQSPAQILLEVGAGKTLCTLAKQHQNLTQSEYICLNSLPNPKQKASLPENQHQDQAFILNNLGQLWLSGVSINWKNLYQTPLPGRVPLPTYPFTRQRYWVERNGSSHTASNHSEAISKLETKTSKPTKKPQLKDWTYLPSWQRSQILTSKVSEVAEKYNCLVFTSYSSFSQQLKVSLKKLGHKVISVSPEFQFSHDNESSYRL